MYSTGCLFLKSEASLGQSPEASVRYSDAAGTGGLEPLGSWVLSVVLGLFAHFPAKTSIYLFCLLHGAKCYLDILEHLRSLARPGLPLCPPQVVSEVMCWMGWGLGEVMSFLSPLPASLGLLVSAESAGS